MRLAARYADGWNYASNLAGTLDGFIERRDRLRAECEAIGRDPDTLTLSVQIIIPAAGEERRAALERAIAYGRAGASEILLTTPARDGAAGIRRLATEVATPFAAPSARYPRRGAASVARSPSMSASVER